MHVMKLSTCVCKMIATCILTASISFCNAYAAERVGTVNKLTYYSFVLIENTRLDSIIENLSWPSRTFYHSTERTIAVKTITNVR